VVTFIPVLGLVGAIHKPDTEKMVLLRQQNDGQQITFLLLQPKILLQQPNILLIELNILLL